MPTPPQPVAIITGAGSGIGKATALRLSTMGYRIALIGRRESPLHAVATEIEKNGGHSLVIPTDVSQFPQVDAMISRVLHEWSRIDVLINNAGMAPSAPLTTMTPAAFHEALNANLASAFYTTRAVWPTLCDQSDSGGGGGGVIINISSMAARDPFPGLGAYAIAKAGINMLTLITAREGAPFHIRAHAIAPGAVNTEMFRNLVSAENVIADEILQPEDVAAAIVDVVAGPFRHTSGDTIYLHHKPA